MDAEQQRAEFLKRLGEEATMHEKGGSLKDQRHVRARTRIDLGTHYGGGVRPRIRRRTARGRRRPFIMQS